jgi:hypothetical protein
MGEPKIKKSLFKAIFKVKNEDGGESLTEVNIIALDMSEALKKSAEVGTAVVKLESVCVIDIE